MDPFSLLSSLLSILDSGLGILSRIFGGGRTPQPPAHVANGGGNHIQYSQRSGRQPQAKLHLWRCYYLKIENRTLKDFRIKLKHKFYSTEVRDWVLSPEISIYIEAGGDFILMDRDNNRIPITFFKYTITNTGNWLMDLEEHHIWLDCYPYQATHCKTYVHTLK